MNQIGVSRNIPCKCGLETAASTIDVEHDRDDSIIGIPRNMLSILVAHSYFVRFDQKQLQRAKPYPPLATLQVAASLRAAGNEVFLFDAMLARGVEEYDDHLRTAKPQVALFYEDNFNYLSKMCLGRMRRATCNMIASARRHGARIIVAGSDATDAPEEYLSAGADVVLLGEGLAALRTLLFRLPKQHDIETRLWIEGLSGVAALIDGQLTKPGGSMLVPEYEHPVQPAWDLIDVERYRTIWREAHGFFSLNMAASRGCSFRCNWCAKPIWGNRYLQRPSTDVASEMAYLKRTLAPDHIWFADDIFGFRVDWVQDFAVAVYALDGSIPFTIQTRADLVSVQMAQALKLAGCSEAWIGAESGSQRILDDMNKGTTIAEIRNARARLGAEGIRVGFFIQLGYLNEQLDDILATRELIESLRPDDIGVSVSYPLPGTKFYEQVKQQLRDQTRWQESNDLAMMFEGTYVSEFYREIRDLLHDQVSMENVRRSEDPHEHQRAQQLLDSRWDALLAQESRYRSDSVRRAASS
jgi:anaerobic magnesium-protoporphyrin IX monomethyl ester cyclase